MFANSGALTVNVSGLFTNKYYFESTGGTLTANVATLLNDTGGYIAALTGTTNLNVSGSTITNNGQIYGFGSTLDLNASAATLTNTATGTIAGTRTGGVLNVTVAGIDNAGSLGSSIGGSGTYNVTDFNNSGLLRSWYALPSDPTTFGAGADTTVNNTNTLTNSGTILVEKGTTMTITGGVAQSGAMSRTQVDGGDGTNAGGKLTIGGTGLTMGTTTGTAGSGGTLAGGGTVVGDVSNLSGIVSPGASPGLLTVQGNYTQGPNGELLIQIEGLTHGTEYDVLNVMGNATLDGTLDINFDSAFQPMLGDTFDFLDYTGILTGNFSNVVVTGLHGQSYSLLQGNNSVDLRITANPADVPEPGAVALLAGLCVMGAGFLRRRKSASVKI